MVGEDRLAEADALVDAQCGRGEIESAAVVEELHVQLLVGLRDTAVIVPADFWARACISAAGRRRPPTWSARKGGSARLLIAVALSILISAVAYPMPQPVAGAVLRQTGSGHGFPTLAPSMSEPSRNDHPNGAVNRTPAERRIRNRALTIGLSVTPFGLSFGAVSVEAHLNLIQVCLLALALFSGASQFALVSIIGAGGSYFSAVGTALLLEVPIGPYGARINALLRPSGWRRLVMAQVTIDESTAMAVSEAPSGHSARAFWSTALSVYVLWNVSTSIGALVGNALGSPATTDSTSPGPPRSSPCLRHASPRSACAWLRSDPG